MSSAPRRPASRTVRRVTLSLLALSLGGGAVLPGPVGGALGPRAARAQPAVDPALEGSDNYNSSFDCVSLGGVVTGTQVIRDNCLQDEKSNEQDRQQTRAFDRWLRGSLLFVASAMNQVRRIGGLVQGTQDLLAGVQKLTRGFKDPVPGLTAFRVADASDNTTDRLARLLEAGNAVTQGVEGRYFVVEAALQEAVQGAREAQLSAASLSENVLALQYRLASTVDSNGVRGGTITRVRPVGGNWRDTVAVGQVCPPLPLGAVAGPGCGSATGDAGDYGEEGSLDMGDAPALAMGRGGSGAGALAMARAAAGGPAGGGPAMAMALAGGGASQVGGGVNCPASMSDDVRRDPVVTYDRIVAETRGAQTAATGALVTATGDRNAAATWRVMENAFAEQRTKRARTRALTKY